MASPPRRPEIRLLIVLSGWGLASACGRTDLRASRLVEEGPGVSVDGGEDGALDSGSAPPPSGGSPGIGAGGLGPVPDPLPPYQPAPALFVHGGKLRDHCGEPLVLRGASEFIGWTTGGDGDPEFLEMAKVGANAARVMWRSEEAPEDLGSVLALASEEGLIPVVELHETFTALPEADALALVMEYWMQPVVVDALRAAEKMVVVELSSWAVTSSEKDEWVELSAEAVGAFRAQGLRMPIALAEPSWGWGNPELAAQAVSELTARDPMGNILLAFDFWGGTPEVLANRYTLFDALGVASYISEFSEYHIRDCPNSPLDVAGILTTAAANDGNWFMWSWGSVPNAGVCAGYLDITTDGTVSGLTEYGTLVALEHPGGISRTAVTLRTQGISACPL